MKNMEHTDFKIGESFWICSKEWRCTDIGQRTVVAIKIEAGRDPSWYNGPPFNWEYVIWLRQPKYPPQQSPALNGERIFTPAPSKPSAPPWNPQVSSSCRRTAAVPLWRIRPVIFSLTYMKTLHLRELSKFYPS